jgi:hypothetical protein
MYNKENKGTSLGSICKVSLAEEPLNQSASLKINVKHVIYKYVVCSKSLGTIFF